MVYTGTLFWRALSISVFLQHSVQCKYTSLWCAMAICIADLEGKQSIEKHTFNCAFSNAVIFSLPPTQQWIAAECYMTCIRLGWAVWQIGIILPLHFIAVRIVTFNAPCKGVSKSLETMALPKNFNFFQRKSMTWNCFNTLHWSNTRT